MIEIACPRCSSSDAEKVAPDVFVCSHCHTRYIVDHGHARLPEGQVRTAVAPAKGRIALLVAGVVGLAIIGGGASSLVTVPKSPPAPTASANVAPRQIPLSSGPKVPSNRPPVPSSRSEMPAPKLPKAELGATSMGKTSIGGHFWLVTYKNSGEVAIVRPSVTVSLFDNNDARVGEQQGYAARDYLRPGESTTVLVLSSKPPAYTRAELSADPNTDSYTSEPLDLEVREHVVNPQSGGRSEVVGTVHNQTDLAAQFIHVLIVGRNDAGDPVAYSNTFASVKHLPPGEQSGFKANLGTWVIEPPKTIEVSAFGRPVN